MIIRRMEAVLTDTALAKRKHMFLVVRPVRCANIPMQPVHLHAITITLRFKSATEHV